MNMDALKVIYMAMLKYNGWVVSFDPFNYTYKIQGQMGRISIDIDADFLKGNLDSVMSREITPVSSWYSDEVYYV